MKFTKLAPSLENLGFELSVKVSGNRVYATLDISTEGLLVSPITVNGTKEEMDEKIIPDLLIKLKDFSNSLKAFGEKPKVLEQFKPLTPEGIKTVEKLVEEKIIVAKVPDILKEEEKVKSPNEEIIDKLDTPNTTVVEDSKPIIPTSSKFWTEELMMDKEKMSTDDLMAECKVLGIDTDATTGKNTNKKVRLLILDYWKNFDGLPKKETEEVKQEVETPKQEIEEDDNPFATDTVDSAELEKEDDSLAMTFEEEIEDDDPFATADDDEDPFA